MSVSVIVGKWMDIPTRFDHGYVNVRQLFLFVDGDQVVLEDSLKHANHSPTGFNIGYAGSGPAQTSLGILLAVTRRPAIALQWYQKFKLAFIAGLKQNEDFVLEVDVEQWMVDMKVSQKIIDEMEIEDLQERQRKEADRGN